MDTTLIGRGGAPVHVRRGRSEISQVVYGIPSASIPGTQVQPISSSSGRRELRRRSVAPRSSAKGTWPKWCSVAVPSLVVALRNNVSAELEVG